MLHFTYVARPSNILLACEGDPCERYLPPAVLGERTECLAMTEPGPGSDLRGGPEGRGSHRDGTKHFVSHADHADYVILLAVTSEEETPRGKGELMTAILIDKGPAGVRGAERLRQCLASWIQQLHSPAERLQAPRAAVLGEVNREI